MNHAAAEAAECTTKGPGRNGGTWQGAFLYLKVHGVDHAVFENVRTQGKELQSLLETDEKSQSSHHKLAEMSRRIFSDRLRRGGFRMYPASSGAPTSSLADRLVRFRNPRYREVGEHHAQVGESSVHRDRDH